MSFDINEVKEEKTLKYTAYKTSPLLLLEVWNPIWPKERERISQTKGNPSNWL